MAIVTSTYRYKRPPRKRKPVTLEAPAIVTKKSSRRPPVGRTAEEAAAEVQRAPVPREEGAAQPSTPRAAERVISLSHRSTSPANDDRKLPAKPAIVTTGRKRRSEADRPHLPMELPLSRKPAPKKPAIVTAKKPAKLLGEPVLIDAPDPPDYEAATAHFRAIIARKLRK